jgi:hypothetical protein
MKHSISSSGSRRLLAAIAWCAFVALGCGDSSGVGTTYPVSGRITLGGQSWTAANTTILFKPDARRGNDSRFEPVGTVDGDGTYTVSTLGREGAPPGWYRVVVAAHDGKVEPARQTRTERPVPTSLLPEKYGAAETTDLFVQVVEEPEEGAYDLKLKP